MILKGKKRGSVAPHREHVALPTVVLQLARIRVPHWGQANARRGFSSTIRVLDMNWEPYPLTKLRTSLNPADCLVRTFASATVLDHLGGMMSNPRVLNIFDSATWKRRRTQW